MNWTVDYRDLEQFSGPSQISYYSHHPSAALPSTSSGAGVLDHELTTSVVLQLHAHHDLVERESRGHIHAYADAETALSMAVAANTTSSKVANSNSSSTDSSLSLLNPVLHAAEELMDDALSFLSVTERVRKRKSTAAPLKKRGKMTTHKANLLPARRKRSALDVNESLAQLARTKGRKSVPEQPLQSNKHALPAEDVTLASVPSAKQDAIPPSVAPLVAVSDNGSSVRTANKLPSLTNTPVQADPLLSDQLPHNFYFVPLSRLVSLRSAVASSTSPLLCQSEFLALLWRNLWDLCAQQTLHAPECVSFR